MLASWSARVVSVGGRPDMVLSAYESSYHLTLIVALVVAFGVVLGGIALVYGWPWLRRHGPSAGSARHRRDRIRPVGTVGSAG